jgi:hypothetical protein
MEVFVIAHYEMKQRKGERERGRKEGRDPFKEGRKGGRDPFCTLGSCSIES